jgi:hypothetical protein
VWGQIRKCSHEMTWTQNYERHVEVLYVNEICWGRGGRRWDDEGRAFQTHGSTCAKEEERA